MLVKKIIFNIFKKVDEVGFNLGLLATDNGGHIKITSLVMHTIKSTNKL